MRLPYRPRWYDYIGLSASGLGAPRMLEVGEVIQAGDFVVRQQPSPTGMGLEVRHVPVHPSKVGDKVTDFGEGIYWRKDAL